MGGLFEDSEGEAAKQEGVCKMGVYLGTAAKQVCTQQCVHNVS